MINKLNVKKNTQTLTKASTLSTTTTTTIIHFLFKIIETMHTNNEC